MKTIAFFPLILFCLVQVKAQFQDYYLYSFPYQEIFEPNEEIPFVTFSMVYENDYTYIETKVCKYRKVRIDFCLCWDPEFHITELIEESGAPCENSENQLFEEEYLSNFEVDNHWYYLDESLENEEHHLHLAGSMDWAPYISYTNTLMNTVDEILTSIIQIYPNPAETTINFSEKVREAVIFNLDGKLLGRIDLPSDKMDVSHLLTGSYLVKGFDVKGRFFKSQFLKK